MSPNAYCSVGTLKSTGTLGITGTDYDTQLLRIAEESSRLIDKYTDRFYYIYEGTTYQDGGAVRVVLDWDVQTVSTLIVDIDGNNLYPTTSAYTIDINSPTTAPDCFAYPLVIYPKTRLEANPFGSKGHLGAGFRKAIKITGTFGFGNDWPLNFYHTATVTVGADSASTATSIDISGNSTSEVTAGLTLKIGSEQMYIKAAPSGSLNSTCSISRAVNGTTAGAPTTGTAISIYDYPQAITQASIIQTIRSWKRRESGFVNTIVNTDMGNIQIFKGLDPDVKEIINQYRRLRIQAYIP